MPLYKITRTALFAYINEVISEMIETNNEHQRVLYLTPNDTFTKWLKEYEDEFNNYNRHQVEFITIGCDDDYYVIKIEDATIDYCDEYTTDTDFVVCSKKDLPYGLYGCDGVDELPDTTYDPKNSEHQRLFKEFLFKIYKPKNKYGDSIEECRIKFKEVFDGVIEDNQTYIDTLLQSMFEFRPSSLGAEIIMTSVRKVYNELYPNKKKTTNTKV